MSGYSQSVVLDIFISPSRKTVYEDQELIVRLDAKQSFETDFEFVLPPGNYCIHLESSEPQMAVSWLTVDNPLPLGEDVYSTPILKFVDCRGVCSGEVQLALIDG